MRIKKTTEDPVFGEFKRIWELEGDERMTRPQIAEYFSRSPYWVQWMYVKTNCRPRTRSPNVKMREESGEDDRLDYIEYMQFKSALVAITKKLLIRSVELMAITPSDPLFSRRFSNLNRMISTTEKRIMAVTAIDPEWYRLPYSIQALDSAKNALNEASKLVRK
jgi:hypothetical protein